MALIRYVLKKVLIAVPEIIGVSALVFTLSHLLPGGPIVANLGPNPTPEQIEILKKQLLLDQPIYIQYLVWLSRVLRGDLGRSFIGGGRPCDVAKGGAGFGISITEALLQRLPCTFELIILSLIISLFIAIPVGIIAAVKKDTWIDYFARTIALMGVSIPDFWLGLILIIIFSVSLRWFPSGGYVPFTEDLYQNLKSMMLPSIALGTIISAITARVLRSSLLEVLNQDYIRTARAKGLRERIVIFRHALKNALIPVITIVGMQFGFLISGAVLIEYVFYLPGIGRLLMESVFRRDYPMIQGVVFIASLAFIVSNIIVDIFYAYLDPRIRY